MSSIVVTGLPDYCKLPKLVYLFKSTLRKEGITKFWIKEMADIRGTNLKLAKVEFNVPNEGYQAIKILNGFLFKSGDFEYPLKARVDEDERHRPRRRSISPYNHRQRGRDYRERFEEKPRFDRDRSRSPISHEASKLDMEIELLRKQRMIIEEERRLLLERKKLELIKEFGPSALKEFRSMEEVRDRRYRPERPPDYKPRRPSPPPRRSPFHSKRPRHRPQSTQIPLFHLPCKILHEEMHELMDKLGTRKESFLLNKHVRSAMRKRLAFILQDKPILPGAKIVALYRDKYPKTGDEEFIKNLLKALRANHLPEKEIKESTSTNNEMEENKKKGSVKREDSDAKNSDDLKPDTNDESANPGWIKQEPDTSLEDGNDNQEQVDKKDYAGSLDSSDVALTLHDKNDEDWAEGEHGWDDNDHTKVDKN